MQIPRLESRRLILREYRQGDLEVFAALNGNPAARARMGGPLTRDEAAERFRDFVGSERGNAPEVWAVTRRQGGDYVGHCWLTLPKGASAPEVGFIVEPKLWNQGYGTEIAVTLLHYSVSCRKLPRVVATVDAEHEACIKVLERAGMKRQGEAKDATGVYYIYSRNR